jgi:hypothetical protein
MSLAFEPRPVQAHNLDQFDVVAEGLGRYTIDVSLPPGYQTSGARYPVILTTDGNILFDIVHVIVHGRFTTVSSVLPASILVGVGYPADEGIVGWLGRRNHDFIGEWAMTDPLGKILHGYFDQLKKAEGKPALQIRAGGYHRFMGFPAGRAASVTGDPISDRPWSAPHPDWSFVGRLLRTQGAVRSHQPVSALRLHQPFHRYRGG